MSLASTNELDGGVCMHTAAVVCEPLLIRHGAETGTETGSETGEPKAVDRDCDAGGLEGNGWVGYVVEARIAAIQNLIKE